MDSLAAHVDARLPEHLALLDRLIRHPSVAAQGRGLEETAAEVEAQMRAAGAGRVERARLDGAPPAVVAEFPGRADRTLLFYNHYDVQPPEPLDEWTAPPFALTVRDGRLYGRGTSDNKGDLVTRLAAVRALREIDGGLPCRVVFLVEGEEEVGSAHFGRYVRALADRLRAGGCVWEYGERDPQDRMHVIAGVKGMCYVEIELEVAARDLHSMWGALVEGAGMRLAQALAGLRGPDGRVRVPGFYDAVRPPRPEALAAAAAVPFDEAYLRAYAGTDRLIEGREGAEAIRALLFEPTCTVCGLEAGYTGAGMKTVLPRRARAKVDFRLVLDQDPDEIVRLLRAHLDRAGLPDCTIRLFGGERAFQTDLADSFVPLVVDAVRQATGREVVLMPTSAGTGPMYDLGHPLGLPILSLGAGYWGGNTHAPDEHIRLADFRETIVMLAHLLRRFAAA